jgi:hypothetical protein
LQAETTDITLKVESLFTASLHLSDFVQTQNEAKIPTDSKELQNKDHNPNDPDISISTQHTNRIGFSCTLSQANIPKNIPIF